ncbi:MAG: putative toxin-antitoxin system toxin component, PIN family [bacterium]|nr:putative toxin-antitoxin system toxin component, PIN family [bacterium]
MKVVLDTNIFISALLFAGKPMQILNLVRKQKIKLFISEPITAEVSRVLKEKFAWQDKNISKVLKKIKGISTTVFPGVNINIIAIDPSDNRILECALEAEADFLISGDKKHLLPLKKFKNIPIVDPDEFLQLIGL